jgi:hypothetical protein
VGNSGGGYAALLFGPLIGANEVLAFSPQTILGRAEDVLYRESLWLAVTERLHARGGPDGRYADLRNALAETGGRPRCQIHYAGGNEIDVLHAERLRNTPCVELHPHDHDGHALIAKLREDGSLSGLLAESLGLPCVDPFKLPLRSSKSTAVSTRALGVAVKLRGAMQRAHSATSARARTPMADA